MWRLANRKKQPGALGSATRFLPAPDRIAACGVMVPLEADDAMAAGAIEGLVSEGVRSMEMWWDGPEQNLDLVMAAGGGNLEPYKHAYSIMYPDVGFYRMDRTMPAWYNERAAYHYFDVSWRHGHFAGVMRDSKWFMTQLASAVQANHRAWIQFAWQGMDVSPYMMGYADAIDSAVGAIKESPEFASNAGPIRRDAQSKMQGPHVILSARGVCDFGPAEYGSGSRIVGPQGGSLAANGGMPGMGNIWAGDDAGYTDGIGMLPFEGVSGAYDYLVKNRYHYRLFWRPGGNAVSAGGMDSGMQRFSIFSRRLIPDPRHTLPQAMRDYVAPERRGRSRRAMPHMVLKPAELMNFARLPDANVRNLRITRGSIMPSISVDKRGFNMGFFEPVRMEEAEYYGMFGRQARSSDARALVISPQDYATHIYSPGATGSGKSSVIKCHAKHLEMSNIYHGMPRSVPVEELRMRGYGHLDGLDGSKTLDELGIGWPCAFIYVDPKGDDSESFVRMCEQESVAEGRVSYIDPMTTGFSMNPLELPEHEPEERDQLVSMYVDYFVEGIKAWYRDPDTFVRMQYILRVIMRFLYQNHREGSPTLADVYRVVSHLRQDASYLKTIYGDMGEPSSGVDVAMENVAALESRAFDPLNTRLERFATDPVVNRMLSVRRGTIPFGRMIRPGSYTVVRLSESDLPLSVINLAMQSFVIHLWYAMERRARHEPEDSRTQVVLALDEFAKLKEISILRTMISQARSKGLGLILAHQDLKQIDDSLLSAITGNFGIQMAGKLDGQDAGRLGQAWDPRYADMIRQQIAVQPRYRWTARMMPEAGQEQPLPVQFWTHFDQHSGRVLRFNLDGEEWRNFVESEKRRYAPAPGDVVKLAQPGNAWMNQLAGPFIEDPREWRIMLETLDEPKTLSELTALFGGEPRDSISKTCGRMIRRGTLARERSRYRVTERGAGMLRLDSAAFGSAKGVPELAGACVSYYARRHHFVGPSKQGATRKIDRTDLVAYRYETATAVSVEIESDSEVASHPEHVEKNMTKWPDMGFGECHVWSFSPKIYDIYDNAVAVAREESISGGRDAALRALEGTRLFVVDRKSLLSPG